VYFSVLQVGVLLFSVFVLVQGLYKTGCAKLMTVCFKYGSIFNRIHIFKHYFAHGLHKHERKKSSSWWYFVCSSTIKLGLLIPTQCTENIINPAKRVLNTSKQYTATVCFLFSLSALSPIHLFSLKKRWMLPRHIWLHIISYILIHLVCL
jgi:hypothetical protein